MKRLTLLVTASTLTLFIHASPAMAICESPLPLRESLGTAKAAFVGMVTETSNEDREARVRVESVWLGPNLPQMIEISGIPSGASEPAGVSLSTSEDRTYEEGARYLFVPENAEPPFNESACSATTLYTDDVAALEPEGAIAPRGQSGRGPVWILVLIALGSLGVWQARRARAHTQAVAGEGPEQT